MFLVRGERSSVVELHLAKVVVVGSNPIARSILLPEFDREKNARLVLPRAGLAVTGN